ncbi:hypothetical protein HY994_01580 [Candidatus Micrarchaeota archaeon]|nr:hypothetical protein [Candidatus Micrarchaeota archaeon]
MTPTVSFAPNPHGDRFDSQVAFLFSGPFAPSNAPGHELFYHVMFTYSHHPTKPLLHASLSVGEAGNPSRTLFSWSHAQSAMDRLPTLSETQFKYPPAGRFTRWRTGRDYTQNVQAVDVPPAIGNRLFSMLQSAFSKPSLFEKATVVPSARPEDPEAAAHAKKEILKWLRSIE